MAVNKLKCNADKTEVLVITPKNKSVNVSIKIDGTVVQVAGCVRNLGVLQDRNLTMEKHVNQVCRTTNFHLRRIGSIRRFLTSEATKSLVHSLITSRLDYCNSLLYALPQTLINKLQCIQNKAARLICRTPYREHITPVLRELHWLPVHRRIEYKVLSYTYKAINSLAPVYLEQLLNKQQSTRCLRSSDSSRLQAPRTKTKYSDRTFSSASAHLWNSLPEHVKCASSLNSFKQNLKTCLFIKEYGQ